MNKKTTLQIEYKFMVQSYKFLDGSDVYDLTSAEQWLTLKRRRKIQSLFNEMMQLYATKEDETKELPDLF